MATEGWIAFFCMVVAVSVAAFCNSLLHLPIWISWVPYLAMTFALYIAIAAPVLYLYNRSKDRNNATGM
jgi:hypothetical protein